ncbi:hypothetical protein PLEOSDRAFT_170822 [Pleurotus ostreatus PC15]|uniref:SET domain-containing protein n=1 Tax=Pleurotus ostreatus (strain PC15) TaxID=1137138 RepID=A0A067N7M5_PLEO1|nr:hypothetical protein PLEOSDRAFT_170822 [Pleurotus ostreatus PC15]
MPNISTNKHTSDANPATTGVTSKPHNLESTNDGAEMNPHRSVCLEVFRNTWDEFYEWERGYCEARLVALMSERRKGTATLTSTAKTARPTSPPGPIWVIPCPTTTIDLSGVLADFDAGPQYESCTPLNGNVYVGDDPDVMPFLPFGEEDWDGYPLPDGGRKRFAYEGYIGEYSELAWMSAFDDPDLDCILYATTNRLASMSISYAQMDATGMFARTPRLPLLSAPSGDPPGLEARAAKSPRLIVGRDFPPFPSLPSPGSSRPSPPAVLSTLRTRIYPLFCHNITCIRQICPTHSEGTPYPHATIPEKKSVYLVDNDSSPCSPTCFLLIAKPSGTALASSTFPNAVLPHAEHGQRGATGALRPAILDSWSAADRDTLITLLELDADARPCDLAVIMKKSCNDIFRFRKRMFPDPMIASRNSGKAPLKPSKHGTRDNILARAHATTPGPAMPPALVCLPTCSASASACATIFAPFAKDVNVNPSGLPKGAIKTAVQREAAAAQNAAPAGAPSVHAIRSNVSGVPLRIPECRLVAIWRLYGRLLVDTAVEVRRSAHGYGLFLKESVLADEFLMEYTGEAILDPTCISRDHIIAHRQRNYLFALHTTLGVDSSLAGDPSRFINHGNPPNLVDGSMSVGEGIANVYSHVEITNGGHGVVLYAGTELLLDYGPKFFKQISGGDEDGDEEDNVNEENVEREEAKKYTYWDDDPEYGEAEEYKE